MVIVVVQILGAHTALRVVITTFTLVSALVALVLRVVVTIETRVRVVNPVSALDIASGGGSEDDDGENDVQKKMLHFLFSFFCF
ncbi:MAG: hypothetical protein P1P90_06530 [Patescibacteria group bacterium]|nr:hypothetical protein [Patescibacteria group bacterium]